MGESDIGPSCQVGARYEAVESSERNNDNLIFTDVSPILATYVKEAWSVIPMKRISNREAGPSREPCQFPMPVLARWSKEALQRPYPKK